MKIKLIFADWRGKGGGKSVYSTEKGIELSAGCFHSGTTFDGEIDLDKFDELDLRASMQDGYEPVFWVMADDKSVAVGSGDEKC